MLRAKHNTVGGTRACPARSTKVRVRRQLGKLTAASGKNRMNGKRKKEKEANNFKCRHFLLNAP